MFGVIIKMKTIPTYILLLVLCIYSVQANSQTPFDSFAPEGAYARIIKDQGLTDFSTDGKVAWKRVKE